MKKIRENEIQISYTGTLEVNGQRIINHSSDCDTIHFFMLKEGHIKLTYWERNFGIAEAEFLVTKSEIVNNVQTYNLWSLENDLELLATRTKWVSTNEQE